MYCTPLCRPWLLETIYIIVIKNICNQENFQFTFDRTESSQALKITNKHYYRRVHKVANEENTNSWHEIFLIRWNIFKESWINEWNGWSIICQIRVLLNMNTTSGGIMSLLRQSLLRHLLLRQSLLRLLILRQWPIVFAVLALLAIQMQYRTAHLTWKEHSFYPGVGSFFRMQRYCF